MDFDFIADDEAEELSENFSAIDIEELKAYEDEWANANSIEQKLETEKRVENGELLNADQFYTFLWRTMWGIIGKKFPSCNAHKDEREVCDIIYKMIKNNPYFQTLLNPKAEEYRNTAMLLAFMYSVVRGIIKDVQNEREARNNAEQHA